MSNPTIFELCEQFHISLAKARKIEKRWPHWFRQSGSDSLDTIRLSLANGDGLAAWMLVELVENPADLLNLGKYASQAEREVAALQNPQGQAAPKEVVANIMEAAKGETEAVEILVDWLKTVIPDKPVSHSFIAVRLLLGVPASIRKYEGPRIPRALMNARNHPGLAGYWHAQQVLSRNVTVYQNQALDL